MRRTFNTLPPILVWMFFIYRKNDSFETNGGQSEMTITMLNCFDLQKQQAHQVAAATVAHKKCRVYIDFRNTIETILFWKFMKKNRILHKQTATAQAAIGQITWTRI